MHQYFPHEKLVVYAKALDFVQLVTPIIDTWSPSVSVRDQLDRASESLVTNLVKAVRLRHTNEGTYYLECSLGSVLECAACLDVASIKHLVGHNQLHEGKQVLKNIAQMEIGLHSTWCSSIHDESESYVSQATAYFAHESLHVYQRSLQLFEAIEMTIFNGVMNGHRYVRRIDEYATSLVLNIAEGNGRYSHPDHGKFVEIAEEVGNKLAAYLDLVRMVCSCDTEPAKELLREVMAMLAGMKGYLDSGSKRQDRGRDKGKDKGKDEGP